MVGPLTHLTGLMLLLALLIGPAGADEIVCSSQSAGYSYCRAGTAKGVTLVEQMGPFACNQGNTWGYDKAGIWVSNGCAARFRLGPVSPSDDIADKARGSGVEALARDMTNNTRQARKSPPPASSQLASPIPPPGAQTATQTPLGEATGQICESKQYKLKKCPVPVRSHVRLKRKLGLAECRFNVTWGYDYGEIWVTDGCRAEFSVY
jgi:hypothetical protein